MWRWCTRCLRENEAQETHAVVMTLVDTATTTPRTDPCTSEVSSPPHPSAEDPRVTAVRRVWAARTMQRILVRERDPVTLSRIHKRFVLRRHGVDVVFDAESLHAFVLATGDVRDPISRLSLIHISEPTRPY